MRMINFPFFSSLICLHRNTCLSFVESSASLDDGLISHYTCLQMWIFISKDNRPAVPPVILLGYLPKISQEFLKQGGVFAGKLFFL